MEYSQQYPSDNRETDLKQYRRIGSFQRRNFITLPMVAPKVQSHTCAVGREVTANEFLACVRRALAAGRLSLMDRAAILTALSSGMDASMLCEVFSFVGYPQIAEAPMNQSGKCPVRVEFVRPKSGQLFYTFVDAVEALEEYPLGGARHPSVACRMS
ncbi:MAG: hypothetical protein JRN39_06515 [Nitrososphaerota archaeon]|nr:hypothetical protein [Nitrososphaerota archaeon]MDG6940036.1 hypothetical protein [Nitrososphaerota archaeon]